MTLEQKRAYYKEYYWKNREKLKQVALNYFNKNKEKYKAQRLIRYTNNKEKYSELGKEYYKNNKQKIDERRKQNKEKLYRTQRLRYINDPAYRFSENMRNRIKSGIKSSKGTKQTKTTELLGCSIEKARKHIESQFTEGMSWDNYCLDGWHIDHIKPCNTFDLTDPDQQKKCFHYTNLRPLWAKDNLSRPRDGSDIL